MHFARTYAELLLSLPPDLTANAIEYKQLKKLINKVVHELESLGLGGSVLQELLDPAYEHNVIGTDDVRAAGDDRLSIQSGHFPKVVYELTGNGDRIEPRLRLWVNQDPEAPGDDWEKMVRESGSSPSDDGASSIDVQSVESTLRPEASTSHSTLQVPAEEIPYVRPRSTSPTPPVGTREVIIPLVNDTAFFSMLTAALDSLSSHLLTVHQDFTATLERLSRDVSSTARPVSATSTFSGFSKSSDPAAVRVPSQSRGFGSFAQGEASKSDLYSWREIFQMYIEAEVFESVHEKDRGERTVEDSEERLRKFLLWVGEQGYVPATSAAGSSKHGNQLKLQQSRKALQSFLQLNIFILNLKKFQLANAEATRKILKKHAKRTHLPLFDITTFHSSSPADISQSASPSNRADDMAAIHITSPALAPQVQFTSAFSLIPKISASLPRVLVQAIGATLLPIIPHVDDYACLICMSIAFKPIRLFCGHLFCVRCLVKMQKRGQGTCPMCRAPTVLSADRSNVDWGLLNFMYDWFPVEARLKLRQNEEEANREEMAELGIDAQGCLIA